MQVRYSSWNCSISIIVYNITCARYGNGRDVTWWIQYIYLYIYICGFRICVCYVKNSTHSSYCCTTVVCTCCGPQSWRDGYSREFHICSTQNKCIQECMPYATNQSDDNLITLLLIVDVTSWGWCCNTITVWSSTVCIVPTAVRRANLRKRTNTIPYCLSLHSHFHSHTVPYIVWWKSFSFHQCNSAAIGIYLI